MSDLPEVVERLSSKLDELERRVYALEHATEAPEPDAEQAAQPLPAQMPRTAEPATDRTTGIFTTVGRAMLGVAGAYLLRAIAESSLLPRPLVAAVAILYAFAWLVWAAQSKSATPMARAIYAGASALILMPMLWELSLRFSVLSPAVCSAVLSAFVILATALAWKHDMAGVYWVAFAAAAPVALTLSYATRAMEPFVLALLLMVLLCEYLVIRERGHGVRVLVALVADAAIWMLIFMYSGPSSARVDYPVLGATALAAPAILLFLINAGGVIVRTLHGGKSVTVFETIQAVAAFLLAAAGVLYFIPQGGEMWLGAVCLALSAMCYWVSFHAFREAEERRNFRVFMLWSAGLFLTGTLLSLPAQAAAACLGVAALAAVAVGVRLECITLDFHGVVFLTAASVVSGMLEYAFRVLAMQVPPPPDWPILLVAALAVLCYATGKERVGEDWQHQVMHFVPAMLAVFAVTALLAQGLLRGVAMFVVPEAFHLAFIRSLTICSVALGLALGGALWERLEMTRISYTALAFEAAKLLFEDLRNGRMEFTAASIFVFAVALISVPRLTRMRHKH